METFYIILALYFALIFIHGAYMAGKEIGREEAFFPKINFKLTFDGTDAIGKLERISEAIKKINNQPAEIINKEKSQRITLFSPGGKLSYGYPFKFEAGGVE